VENPRKQSNKGSKKQLVVCGLLFGSFVLFLIGHGIYDQFWNMPSIMIVNQSNTQLNDLNLSGTGFQRSIEFIPPKTTRWITVKPTGESSLKVSFTADNKFYSKDDLAYFEPCGGYQVRVLINPALDIEAESQF
jgi:hypothetical protein